MSIFDDVFKKAVKREQDPEKTIDFFDEECRQNIYEWSAKRYKKEQKSYWYRLRIYMISWKVIFKEEKGPLSTFQILDLQHIQFFYCAENGKKNLLIVHLREYLQTRSPSKRAYLIRVVYEDISDLTQLIEIYHIRTIAGIVPLMARFYLTQQILISCIEKLRAIRDYRSPRAARSFAKIMMFFTPILFSPLYVYMSQLVPETSSWTAYIFGAITAFIFGCLQSVQDRLDDPFLGITYDEINLDDLHIWANESLKHNANRTDVIGRFTVNSQTPGLNTDNINGLKDNGADDKTVELLKTHPYLAALHGTDSFKTIRITRTQEIPGRNRIIFLRQEQPLPIKEEKTDT